MRTLILSCLAVFPAFAEGDAPYPKGTSNQTHGGMEFTLVVPSDYDPAKKYAAIIALHGMNGKATNVAGIFSALSNHGFIVCAPQCAKAGWDQPNVDRAKDVLSHLIEKLSIDPKRLHGAAFSQGCGSLASVVFDKKFHFISASWSMGGSTGGKVPGWAKKEMGAITLVGSEDWARGAAEGTVKQLAKKVRQVECHVQKGIGHEFPGKLTDYHHYWLRVMDGWFEPGEVGFFDWTDELAEAAARSKQEKKAILAYLYSKKDSTNAETRRVQNGVFFDPLVRHYGRQVLTVRMPLETNVKVAEEMGIKATPAIVVLLPDGSTARQFVGNKIQAAALAKELRKHAKDRKPPKVPGVFVHR